MTDWPVEHVVSGDGSVDVGDNVPCKGVLCVREKGRGGHSSF